MCAICPIGVPISETWVVTVWSLEFKSVRVVYVNLQDSVCQALYFEHFLLIFLDIYQVVFSDSIDWCLKILVKH